jgi:fucose permease
MIFILLSGIYLFFYVGAEITFSGWIATYSLDIGWASVRVSDYLTSTFWLAFTLGRFLSIPLSVKLHISVVLLIDLIGSLLSMFFLGLAQFAVLHLHFPVWFGKTAMWMCTITFGFSLANMYPCVASLRTEAGKRVTGANTGLLAFFGACGDSSLPFLCAQLLDLTGPEALPWFVFTIFVCSLILFGFLLRSANISLRSLISIFK